MLEPEELIPRRPQRGSRYTSTRAGVGERCTIATGQINHAVHQLTTRICAHNHVVAQRLRLGGTDSRTLALLTLHGSLTPGRLAGFTGLSTGTVTGVIDRLERAQMVRRDRNPANRRSVHVTSTPAATPRIAAEYTDWISKIGGRNRLDAIRIARDAGWL